MADINVDKVPGMVFHVQCPCFDTWFYEPESPPSGTIRVIL